MATQLSNSYLQRFSGIGRLYGQTALERLSQAHFCIVGIGGVGSWTAEALARTVMSRAPLAIAQQKRLLAQAVDADFETMLNLEKQTIANLIITEDYGEGITAFSEKRKPKFKGR